MYAPELLHCVRNDGYPVVIARRYDEAIQVQATTWIASPRSLVTGMYAPGLLHCVRNDGYPVVIARRNDEAILMQATTWIASLRSQ
jgi:PHD/YefM family antitoxin component YafN of YafNO toxin-antitoxin module